MDIVVKGRHCEVPERFRKHVTEKLTKVEKLDRRVISVDVVVSKEHNPRQADFSQRVEITCHSRGPVIRAEAAAADPYAAMDLAWQRLESRLRRVADRKRVHHGAKSPVSVSRATSSLSANGNVPGLLAVDAAADEEEADNGSKGPMVLRQKIHEARPMTVDQALYEMELVGHDFYLFLDSASGCPSVVYRRHAYDYGVIALQLAEQVST